VRAAIKILACNSGSGRTPTEEEAASLASLEEKHGLTVPRTFLSFAQNLCDMLYYDHNFKN
jgi:hypothetical protein